ncbi:hypothetical protein QVD17_23930 [Tagetes erecta]|uniref:Uncharacterized protein n=1 Tax=Tagetes erecta TaxID=13708 RepID=A0AAD8KEL6_TARER|nr:hypothetical protein QVD17_23930 [Tagetes erecta]
MHVVNNSRVANTHITYPAAILPLPPPPLFSLSIETSNQSTLDFISQSSYSPLLVPVSAFKFSFVVNF